MIVGQEKLIKAQYFHYKILETASLDRLEEFKDHKRLRVFYEKGCKCVECGITGTQLALGKGRGELHWDIYTDDFYPLTVDHIIPKSKGGSDHIDNLQPMCYLCNMKKGNGDKSYSSIKVKYTKEFRLTHKVFEKGYLLYRQLKGRKKSKFLGIVDKIVINPATNTTAVMIEGNSTSMYNIGNALFAIKPE